MRSAVMLEFLPKAPSSSSHASTTSPERAKRREEVHEQSLFAVLAERSTFVTYALPARASADAASTGTSSRVTLASATPAFGHHLIEAVSHLLCEPLRADDLAAVTAAPRGVGVRWRGWRGWRERWWRRWRRRRWGGGAGAAYRAATGGSGRHHASPLIHGTLCRRRHVVSVTRRLSAAASGCTPGWPASST